MNSDEDSARYSIRSVDRALDILEAVAGANGEMTVDQIVVATGLPKSTAFRVLATLTARRLLERDAQTQTYRLGMLALGMVISVMEVPRVALILWLSVWKTAPICGQIDDLRTRNRL